MSKVVGGLLIGGIGVGYLLCTKKGRATLSKMHDAYKANRARKALEKEQKAIEAEKAREEEIAKEIKFLKAQGLKDKSIGMIIKRAYY